MDVKPLKHIQAQARVFPVSRAVQALGERLVWQEREHVWLIAVRENPPAAKVTIQ